MPLAMVPKCDKRCTVISMCIFYRLLKTHCCLYYNIVPVNTNGDWPCLIEKYAIIDDTMTTRTLLPVVSKKSIAEYDFAFTPLALIFIDFKLCKRGAMFFKLQTFGLHCMYYANSPSILSARRYIAVP